MSKQSSSVSVLSRRSWLFGTGAVLACAHAPMPKSVASRHLGAPLPAFTGTTVNGSEFDSNSSLGLVLVVQFFEPGCGACDARFEEAAEIYDHRGVVMVGVSFEPSVQVARAVVMQHALKFPVLFDPERSVASRLDVGGPKTGLAVDRFGILRWVGDASRPGVMRDAAEALLDEA